MVRYDPLSPPDPADWQATDEAERIRLVEMFHRRARVRIPGPEMHALMHVIVENQIALGDEIPVRRAALRLMDEGLDRHEAIHAIASVLAGQMFDLAREPTKASDTTQTYYARLEQLTAESWRKSG